jgi:hypothetical protein
VEAETQKYLLDYVKRFRKLIGELPVEAYLNPSSDQISYTVSVVGYHLDNAQGEYISLDGITKGFQEIVLVVETFYSGRPEKKKFITENFNLATLIATLREFAPKDEPTNHSREYDTYARSSEAFDALGGLRTITQYCRPDMHEPDEQGIEGYVLANYFNKDSNIQRPRPAVRIVKDNALGVKLLVDDLLYLMGTIRRV